MGVFGWMRIVREVALVLPLVARAVRVPWFQDSGRREARQPSRCYSCFPLTLCNRRASFLATLAVEPGDDRARSITEPWDPSGTEEFMWASGLVSSTLRAARQSLGDMLALEGQAQRQWLAGSNHGRCGQQPGSGS